MTQYLCNGIVCILLLFLLAGGCATSGQERTLTATPRTAEATPETTPPVDPGPGSREEPPVTVLTVGGDRDADGIADDADLCPDGPEDLDSFEDADGCPEPDNDADGIPDMNDQCPNDPETLNGLQDADGCPD